MWRPRPGVYHVHLVSRLILSRGLNFWLTKLWVSELLPVYLRLGQCPLPLGRLFPMGAAHAKKKARALYVTHSTQVWETPVSWS